MDSYRSSGPKAQRASTAHHIHVGRKLRLPACFYHLSMCTHSHPEDMQSYYPVWELCTYGIVHALQQ